MFEGDIADTCLFKYDSHLTNDSDLEMGDILYLHSKQAICLTRKDAMNKYFNCSLNYSLP